MHKRVLLLGLALALVFSAPLATTAAEPKNLSALKQQIDTYVDSGDYERGLAKVAAAAAKYLEKRIPRGALAGKKLAVVFDIDETTLSNIGHIRQNDYGYVPVIWEAWVAEATAPVIAPVKAVYDAAVKGGVTVFFVTGRRASDQRGTAKNLHDAGYLTWERVYYKPNEDKGTSAAFKTDVRREIEASGYVIIANLGDQESDLVGGYAEKTFKLPNPFYIAN